MYRFKLQALLNHRLHQEEVCQKELAAARQDLSAAQEKLKCLKKEKREKIQQLQATQSRPHHAAYIVLIKNYLDQLSQNIDAQLELVRSASRVVNQKREHLIAAMKKRKTLEKLKEKEWQEYQNKILQAERKFNDEVAANRHILKI